MSRPRLAATVGVVFALALGLPLQGQQPTSRPDSASQTVSIQLHGDTVRVIANDVDFIAPYRIGAGETFRSIAKKFYGSARSGEDLARTAGKSVDDAPGLVEAGTGNRYMYIESKELKLVIPAAARDSIAPAIRAFLDRYANARQLTLKWFGVDVDLGITSELKPFFTKWELAGLTFLPPKGISGPTLRITFDKQPELNLFTGFVPIRKAVLERAVASAKTVP